MKKIQLLLVLIFFFPVSMLAQTISYEMGKIGMEEVEMKSYPKDPSAEAVVLFDLGDSRFVDAADYNYNIEFTRFRRIKIFTNAGLSYAEVKIPFYISENGDAEIIKSIEAYCYNWENGQLNRSALNPSSVYEEKINERWSQRKFVIPKVKPGSVIEYKYVLTTPFLFNLPSWKFQSHIPTIYSKYIVRMIPFYQYSYIVQGTNKLDNLTPVKDPEERVWGILSRESGHDLGFGVRFHDLVSTFVMKDVPAFRDESYITSDEDYLIKLDLQEAKIIYPTGREEEIMSTWPKLVVGLLKNDHFGKYLKASEKSAGKVLETTIDLNGKSLIEKSKTIINYVKTAFKWDEINSIYCMKNQREFSDQKRGNSAEINLYMVALLRSAGIDASPVLISTRPHGKIYYKYPFLHYFNYIIVKVNAEGKEFLCDGADYYTGYDRIPSKCINDKGLVINEGDVSWVNLNQDYNSTDKKEVSIDIDPASLKASVKLALEATEFDSYYYKDYFSNDTVKLKKFLSENGISIVNRIKTENFNDNSLPYVLNCEGVADIEQLNDKLVVSPYFGFYPKENKLTASTRIYPVDLVFANTESYKCTVKIPDGYKVLNLPENIDTDNEMVKIRVNYTASGNRINIDSEYSFKKAVYQPADYESLKYYFETIVKKFSEQVILVRK